MAKLEGVQRTYLMKEIDRIQQLKIDALPRFDIDTPYFQEMALLALANALRCVSLKKGACEFDFGYHNGDDALAAFIRNRDKFNINDKDYIGAIAGITRKQKAHDVARDEKCDKIRKKATEMRREAMLGDAKTLIDALIAFEKEVF